jgi:hypothetical protein
MVSVDLFTIAKSENRNQVQYAVRVDERCAPVGAEPVFAYWRMLERGPRQTEPLLGIEQAAYGVRSQTILSSTDTGARVRVALRAMSDRPVEVQTWRAEGGECHASAVTTIAGAPARLFNVYAKLAWPFGVESILVQGWSIDGGAVVRETIAAR